MEKYRARKLLRGLLSFPAHVQMHYVLATDCIWNLSFRNSLILEKVYLCGWGWKKRWREDAGRRHLDALWNQTASLGFTVTRADLETEHLIRAQGASKSPELAPKRSQVCPAENTGQFCMFTLDDWFHAHLFFRCISWPLVFPSTPTNIYQATPLSGHCFRQWGTKDKLHCTQRACIPVEGNGQWIK